MKKKSLRVRASKQKQKMYIPSIEGEISKPIHWCPFSERVSPLSPDPQPKRESKQKC